MQVEKFVRVPLSLFTRLRLVLLGHEELVGVVFWAALVGFCGALASVAFRESARLLEHLFTGESGDLQCARRERNRASDRRDDRFAWS